MRRHFTRVCLLSLGLAWPGCTEGEYKYRPEEPLQMDSGEPITSAVDAAGLEPSSDAARDPTHDAAHDAGLALDAGTDELAAALDASGYRNDMRRVELVVGALCRHQAECGSPESEDACRATFRVDWQDRVAQGRGLHVPCHDALLDTISCLASAPCDDPTVCDALVKTQDTVCSQGPIPSRCSEWHPQLDAQDGGGLAAQDGGAPTKGPIPPEAQNPGGRGLNWELVPDFIPALASDGSIAGYIRKVDLMDFGCETKTVVDETLQHVVGHMVPGVGFVPLDRGAGDAG